MAATVTSIADAVVAALNAGAFSIKFEAARHYVPAHEINDLASLKVTVVPASITDTLLDRRPTTQTDYAIDIGIQKRVGKGAMTRLELVEACDPLMGLAEEIGDAFRGRRLDGYENASCIATDAKPIYDPQHLHESTVFTAVVTLTFRLAR